MRMTNHRKNLNEKLQKLPKKRLGCKMFELREPSELQA